MTAPTGAPANQDKLANKGGAGGRTIGVLVDFLSGPFQGQVIGGIHHLARRASARVVAIQTVGTGSDYHREIIIDQLGPVAWARVDGFIAIANAVPASYLGALRDAGKPVVSLGNEGPDFPCPVVLADNKAGTQEAIEHLLAHGHRRIAFVGHLAEFDIRERYQAYQATLRANGITPGPELFFPAENNLEHGAVPAAQALLAAGLPSTALFAATDLNAVGVIKVLAGAGLELPRDQAVIGFDDDPNSSLVSPALSTVSFSPADLGELAAQLLLEELSGAAVPPRGHTVPTRFVTRESCGCVATGGASGGGTGGGGVGEGGVGGGGAGGGGVGEGEPGQGERNDAYYGLRAMVREHYKITLDLFDNRERDPRLLDWLSNTATRAGVLGLWPERGGADRRARPDPTGELEIVGMFAAPGVALGACPTTVSPQEFPPAALLAAGAADSWLVYVFPLKSTGSDWGYLATSQPPVPQLDQETYFTWSALFSEALHHRDLLRSLSQRSEELAISYEREKEMAQAVRESEERYALAVRATNDGLWDLDVATGELYISPRLQEMLALPAGGPGSLEAWRQRVHPEDRDGLVADVIRIMSGEAASMISEHRVLASNGEYLWAHCRALGVPGRGRPATRIVGSLADVTERRAMEERLRQQALYDELTGLANRGLLLDRLSQAMALARRRSDYDYAVLWLDLDGFKAVNDVFGHLQGDYLLQQVAERVRAHTRDTDTAARFGGDEFVVLLQVEDAGSVERAVSRMADHLRAPYQLGRADVQVTASIGVALGSPIYDRPEEILRDADSAMYAAKSAGPGWYSVHGTGPSPMRS
ncbi:MAG TPA: diguanylate cyclase [Acidimicrobiales bacterium]|nr:diguanylate cyclase [Acidimicrobiales bacterium]